MAGLALEPQAGLAILTAGGPALARTAACEEEPRTAVGLRGPRTAGVNEP